MSPGWAPSLWPRPLPWADRGFELSDEVKASKKYGSTNRTFFKKKNQKLQVDWEGLWNENTISFLYAVLPL